MISDGGPTLAAAIGAAVAGTLGEGVAVAVDPSPPETAAPPCVWLVFVGARYDGGRGWLISLGATVVADAALGAVDAAAQLAAMTDAVLTMTAPGVEPRAMTARGEGLTTRWATSPIPAPS